MNFDNDIARAIDILGGKLITYAYYQENFSKAREEAYNKGLAGIGDYDDILHYLNWETPRLQLDTVGFSSGVYAGDNTWHRGVRQIYSELAYDQVSKDYTTYALSIGKDKMLEIADEIGIDIKSVIFKPDRNGQNSNGNANNEYTIVGTIK